MYCQQEFGDSASDILRAGSVPGILEPAALRAAVRFHGALVTKQIAHFTVYYTVAGLDKAIEEFTIKQLLVHFPKQLGHLLTTASHEPADDKYELGAPVKSAQTCTRDKSETKISPLLSSMAIA
jgi:hypothetical protein